MDHEVLTPAAAVSHVQSRTSLFPAGAKLTATSISGVSESVEGYVNEILRVTDGRTSVVVKQVLPYIRMIRDLHDEPLSLRRAKTEVEAFRLLNGLVPGCAPEVYDFDEEKGVVVMEDLAALRLARFEFAKLRDFPDFGCQVGHLLGTAAFFTSDHYLDSIPKKNLVARFSNPDFREVYEKAFFSWAFFREFDHPDDRPIATDLSDFVDDPAVRVELLTLRQLYLTSSESFIHNDFHTSNIFVGPESVRVIDGEAAGWGPTAWDLGTVIGNLIVNCMSLQVLDGVSAEEKIGFEEYLLRTVQQLLDTFNTSFTDAWQRHAQPECRATPGYLDAVLRQILQEAAGYAGISAFGRCHGPGVSYDFRRITSGSARAVGQRLVIRAARALLLERHRFATPNHLVAVLADIKRGHRITQLVTAALHRLGA